MAIKPGRPSRSPEKTAELRAKITATALRIFQSDGYKAVSIRKLAKEVGCAPMTIYAHFDAKIDILQHLWRVVLDEVFAEIETKTKAQDTATDRLHVAVLTFTNFWLENPDHFRLVFMSNDIERADVNAFMSENHAQSYFEFFQNLVGDVVADKTQVQGKTDTLVVFMLGVALCANTIKAYSWSPVDLMVDEMLKSILPK